MDLGFLGNMALEWLLNNPLVAAWLAGFAVFSATAFTVSTVLESFAVMLWPFVKWTKTKEDDKWLEIGIYWLDAVGDVFQKTAGYKWMKAVAVIKRIKDDLGLPYKERRRD